MNGWKLHDNRYLFYVFFQPKATHEIISMFEYFSETYRFRMIISNGFSVFRSVNSEEAPVWLEAENGSRRDLR